MQLSNIINTATNTVKGNAPEILTGLGVAGVATTAYLTGKASYRVARDEDADPHASNKEKFKRHWKKYVPATISGAVTVTCIIAAAKTSSKRTAAAVTAYSVVEKAFTEYREKVVEQIGENKEQKIRDEIAQERVSKNPPTQVIITPGNVLCCELYTHRYFESDMDTLLKAKNNINHLVNTEMYVSMDEFYDMIGLAHTAVSGELGWNYEKLMELEFSTVLSEDGRPCIAFLYNYVKPLRD